MQEPAVSEMTPSESVATSDEEVKVGLEIQSQILIGFLCSDYNGNFHRLCSKIPTPVVRLCWHFQKTKTDKIRVTVNLHLTLG